VTTTGDCCETCLRRSWLLAELAPYIEKSAAHARGRRVAELLAHDDGELLAAVAPRHAERLAAAVAAISEDEMRSAVALADCWAICRHCPEYPEGLRNLSDAPAALFGRGNPGLLAALTLERSVTVVGARRASSYGLAVARDLGRELAMAGLTVISGMALGIDGAVHRGALETGLSCGVLGGGVDCIYPPRHRSLYERHLESGLLLSELPVGTASWRWMFPARNRLMAAMAGMTVVVEARARSGSLITATMAQELGRDLGAVPGPVTAAVSQGTNDLLAQGACVIRGAQDVLDAMLGVGQVQLAAGPRLDPEQRLALDSFELSEGDLDRFEVLLGKGPSAAAVALTQLEHLGYINRSELGVWRRTSLEPPAAPKDPTLDTL
jgi:DNA processing protein